MCVTALLSCTQRTHSHTRRIDYEITLHFLRSFVCVAVCCASHFFSAYLISIIITQRSTGCRTAHLNCTQWALMVRKYLCNVQTCLGRIEDRMSIEHLVHSVACDGIRGPTHTRAHMIRWMSDDSECARGEGRRNKTERDSANNVNRHARATSVCCICNVHYQYGRFFRVECIGIEQIYIHGSI